MVDVNAFKLTLIKLSIFAFFVCELIYPAVSILSAPAFANVLCNSVILLLFFVALIENISNFNISVVLLILFCVLAFVVTGIAYPEYHDVIYDENNIWTNVFHPRSGFMLMLILTIADDPKDIFQALKFSTIPVWLSYTIRVMTGVGLSKTSNSNHDYGYAFLFVAIMCTICFFRERKMYYLIGAIVSVFQILMFASRTAILSYVVFFVLYALFCYNNEKLNWKKILFIIIGLIVAFIVTSELFLTFLSDIINQLGRSSRIIDAFISRDFELDGGRERIYEQAISLIKEHPWGLGVYWDRYYLEESTYVHSFIYEILLDFGWVVGGLIFAVLIKNIVVILRSKEREWKILLVLFFSLSMIRLTLSYSFWYDTYFWGMIAVIIGYRYSVRKKKKIAFRENRNKK